MLSGNQRTYLYSRGSGLSIDIHFVDIELSYDVLSPLPTLLSKHFNHPHPYIEIVIFSLLTSDIIYSFTPCRSQVNIFFFMHTVFLTIVHCHNMHTPPMLMQHTPLNYYTHLRYKHTCTLSEWDGT